MITIIIHPFRPFKTTNNTTCLWFFTIYRYDLFAQLQKGVKMYKELKQDKKILDNLLSNIQGNGFKEGSDKRKSKKRNGKKI